MAVCEKLEKCPFYQGKMSMDSGIRNNQFLSQYGGAGQKNNRRKQEIR